MFLFLVAFLNNIYKVFSYSLPVFYKLLNSSLDFCSRSVVAQNAVSGEILEVNQDGLEWCNDL